MGFRKTKNIRMIKKLKLWFLNQEEKKAISDFPLRKNFNSKNFSLVQCPHDLVYSSAFGKIVQLNPESSFGGLCPNITYVSFTYWILIIPSLLKQFYHLIIRKKWKKIYSFIELDLFFYPNSPPVFKKIKYLYLAIIEFRKLKFKKDILKHSFNGILCGDLIYDSYLRFNKKPTLNIFDPTLILFIYDCYCQISYYENLSEKYVIQKYYSTYSSYISHGIPVRVFLKNGIQVFTIGHTIDKVDSADKIKIKELNPDDPSDDHPHWEYRKIFNTLNDKENLIKNAFTKFSKRFQGENDLDYMESNQYSKDYKSIKFKDKYDGVVFIGDFFDKQHCYRTMIFNDLYEWLIHTIQLTIKNNLNIGFKTHPNQLRSSKIMIDIIKLRFPSIRWISSKVSNKVIFSSGIKFGISIYGTVLPELAFHNIKPICCADNPASEYDFIFEAKNKEEYDYLVMNHEILKLNKNSKEQLGEFYHMNNIYFPSMSKYIGQ